MEAQEKREEIIVRDLQDLLSMASERISRALASGIGVWSEDKNV